MAISVATVRTRADTDGDGAADSTGDADGDSDGDSDGEGDGGGDEDIFLAYHNCEQCSLDGDRFITNKTTFDLQKRR